MPSGVYNRTKACRAAHSHPYKEGITHKKHKLMSPEAKDISYPRYQHTEEINQKVRKTMMGQNTLPDRDKLTKVDYRERLVENVYGITPEGWFTMFEEQNGCCDICGKHQSDLKRILFIDHNHTTGEVRGLLCDHCNRKLGIVEDSKYLTAALNYLNKHKSREDKQ